MKRTMFRKRTPRTTFERSLQGTWYFTESSPHVRTNGRWTTWTGPSKLVPQQPAKFAKPKHGPALEARTWAALAALI